MSDYAKQSDGAHAEKLRRAAAFMATLEPDEVEVTGFNDTHHRYLNAVTGEERVGEAIA